jgi:hypothetical protein
MATCRLAILDAGGARSGKPHLSVDHVDKPFPLPASTSYRVERKRKPETSEHTTVAASTNALSASMILSGPCHLTLKYRETHDHRILRTLSTYNGDAGNAQVSGDRAGELKTRWTKPPARCRGYGDSKSPNDAGLTEWMVELGDCGLRARRKRHRRAVSEGRRQLRQCGSRVCDAERRRHPWLDRAKQIGPRLG